MADDPQAISSVEDTDGGSALAGLLGPARRLDTLDQGYFTVGTTEGIAVVPDWALDHAGKPLPGLTEALAVLDATSTDRWTIALWPLRTPDELDGRSVAGHLAAGGNLEPALAAAHRIAGRWTR